jgi:hypothetical protein
LVSHSKGITQAEVFENRVLWRKLGPKRKWQEAGEECIMRSLTSCMFQIKEDEICVACSTYGRDEKFIQYFGWKTSWEETRRR